MDAPANYGYLGGPYISKIADLKWPNEVCSFVHVKLACIVVNLLSPACEIKENRCQLLREADVVKLQKKNMIEDVRQAEEMMELARTELNNHGPAIISTADKYMMLGKHDSTSLRHMRRPFGDSQVPTPRTRAAIAASNIKVATLLGKNWPRFYCPGTG